MIRFKDVGFSYGNQKIFSNLTFRLERSGYMVISGPARSGKTTLVQMITGMALPDAGDVIIDGEYIEDIAGSKTKLSHLRRKIGGVGGIYSLLGDRTVLENIALSAEIAGFPARAARKKALEACGKYRLSHIAGHYSGMISEAERRMAQIARVEAARKNLIVADSPTDGLDPKSARFINEHLASLHLAGVTILYLTTGSGPETGPDEYLRFQDGRLVR